MECMEPKACGSFYRKFNLMPININNIYTIFVNNYFFLIFFMEKIVLCFYFQKSFEGATYC